MKYELTRNVKKAINEFEETLKIFANREQARQEEINEIKKKLENAILLIKEMEG